MNFSMMARKLELLRLIMVATLFFCQLNLLAKSKIFTPLNQSTRVHITVLLRTPPNTTYAAVVSSREVAVVTVFSSILVYHQ